MSAAKVTVTYKRKRGAAKALAADGVAPEPPPPVSGRGVASSEASKRRVADADSDVLNGDDSSTCTKGQDACKSMQQSAEKETAKPCAHTAEKEHKEIQLCESLPQVERPEIHSATSLPVAEACNNELQCTNDAFNPIPAPSYACDHRNDDGIINQEEDSNNLAPTRIVYHQAPDDTTRPSQSMIRFSSLHTFQRRVKRKINLGEPAQGSYSEDNDKRCSTLTCSQPSLLVNATSLLKETGGNSSDTKYKSLLALPIEKLSDILMGQLWMYDITGPLNVQGIIEFLHMADIFKPKSSTRKLKIGSSGICLPPESTRRAHPTTHCLPAVSNPQHDVQIGVVGHP